MQNATITVVQSSAVTVGPFALTAKSIGYNSIVPAATNTLYSDPTQALATPVTLKVAHETSKDGVITNSALLLRKEKVDIVTGKVGYAQATIKLTSDTDVISKADQRELLYQLAVAIVGGFTPGVNVALASGTIQSSFDVDKFLNLEH